MPRPLLVVLLVAAVVCAGIGVTLSGDPFAAPSFGWTAYSPLSSASYAPVDVTWLTWARRIGLAMVAIGAGSTGALLAALILRRPPAAQEADRAAPETD